MKCYDERRVTVYDVIFGKLRFLDSHTAQPPCIIELSKLYQKPNLGELAVTNGNSPNC